MVSASWCFKQASCPCWFVAFVGASGQVCVTDFHQMLPVHLKDLVLPSDPISRGQCSQWSAGYRILNLWELHGVKRHPMILSRSAGSDVGCKSMGYNFLLNALA